MPKQARQLSLEYFPLTDLLEWPSNAKDHDVGLIDSSMQRFGFVDPIILDERSGKIAAGHGRQKVLEARKLAAEDPPANILIRDDGEWLVPVVRGWASANDRELDALTVALNQSVIAGGWVDPKLKDILVAVGTQTPAGLEGLGFDTSDVEDLIANLDKQRGSAMAPPAPKEPWVKVGDLFALGEHRLLCGNSTRPAHVQRLLRGAGVDAVLTDPPYCSGGFQEADRIQGSIGTTKKDYTGQTVSIANDVLSTRGYKALLTTALDIFNAKLAYIFTDWRMWTNLTDLMESQGYGIRSMIVWDKGAPGMGIGWRSQHELIACGTRVKAPFTHKEARGNVIRCDRSGNEHHPTEKPVELLKIILETTGMAKRVADPFTGSGSTVIACEQLGRVCYAMELSPYFAQVCLERWAQFTGKQWEQLEEGEATAAVHHAGARRVRAAASAKRRSA